MPSDEKENHVRPASDSVLSPSQSAPETPVPENALASPRPRGAQSGPKAPDFSALTDDPQEIELIWQAGVFFGRGGSQRGQRKILESSRIRRQRLQIGPGEYLSRLRCEPSEWDELWNLADAERADSFFRFPAQFEVLSQLISERAVTAAERRLKVLSAGCGSGHEP
jgi:hypothetical protein